MRELRNIEVKLIRGGSARTAERFRAAHTDKLLHAGGALTAGGFATGITGHPAPLAMAAGFTHGVAHTAGRLKRAASFLEKRAARRQRKR